MRKIRGIIWSLILLSFTIFELNALNFSISSGTNYLYQTEQNYTDFTLWSNAGFSYNYNISETLSLFVDSAVSTEYHLLTGDTDGITSLHIETTYRNEPFFVGINLNPYIKISLPSKIISGELELQVPLSLDFFTFAIFCTPKAIIDFENTTITSTDYSIEGGTSFIVMDQLILKPSVGMGITRSSTDTPNPTQAIYIQPEIGLSWFSSSIFSLNANLSYKFSYSDQLPTNEIYFTPQFTYYSGETGITIRGELETSYFVETQTQETQNTFNLEINPSVTINYQLTDRVTITFRSTLFDTFDINYSDTSTTNSMAPFISLSLKYLF